MKNIFSKILVSFLIIAVVATGFIFPKKTQAIFGVGDISFDPTLFFETFLEFFETLYKWMEDELKLALRDTVAKKIIDYIVDQTIVWIQGGGEPKFVTDWQGFLKDAGNIAFEQILKDVGLAWLCEPFSLQVRISLLPVPRFSQQVECTLDDVVSNIEDFYKDFENGGWIAYNESWQPQNNYFGLTLMIHDETLTKMAKETEAAANEALAGKGFLSVKKCLSYDDVTGKCLKETILTPGDTVGQVIAKGMTSDIEWAANIESWTSALVNAVINRLITEGVGLISDTPPPTPDVYYPPDYQDNRDQDFERTKNELLTKYQSFLGPLNIIITLKEKSLSLSQELLSTYKAINDYNCTPLIPESEILRVQAEINASSTITINVGSTITQFRDLAVELNEKINRLSPLTSVDTQQFQQAVWESIDFFRIYNEFFIDLTMTNETKQALEGEIRKKETDLASAKSQLEGCLPPSTATSTSPNQP